MRTSYSEDDVKLLLKDITGLVEPQPAEERERLIQSGRHYCEMLPFEYVPSEEYMEAYKRALKNYAKPVALATGKLTDKIIEKRGKNIVLVSLARAGIPIGILLKRYFKFKYNIDIAHYSISIIRGRGIDKNAINYLLERYEAQRLLFIDGWVGKGAILNELKKDLQEFPDIRNDIAVLSDPANVTVLCGTHEDILVPSSCLNCTVSGLISRTFLRSDIIGANDFHGAVYYDNLADSDLSYEFIHTIEKEFVLESPNKNKIFADEVEIIKGKGIDEAKKIAREYGIDDINLVKPGIGETTRVLLRRVPWKVLVKNEYKESQELVHIIKLAAEKNVPVEYYPLKHYKACGIIKKLGDI